MKLEHFQEIGLKFSGNSINPFRKEGKSGGGLDGRPLIAPLILKTTITCHYLDSENIAYRSILNLAILMSTFSEGGSPVNRI